MATILIIDDDPGFRKLLETILTGEGYDIDFFHPDVEWQNSPGFPGGQEHRGREAVAADMDAQGEAWESRRVEVHEVIPASDQVIVADTRGPSDPPIRRTK